MRLVYSFALILITCISFIACSKHPGDIVEKIPQAQIEITLPVENAEFHMGDSLSLQGFAISTATIHGYDFVVKSASDTTVYYKKHIHDHDSTVYFNEKWKCEMSEPCTLEAGVILSLDHDGHKASKFVKFNLH